MEYKKMDDKLSLLKDEVEVGYITFTNTSNQITIEQTYIFPGFRKNGYAKLLIKYMVDNFEEQIIESKCSYYKIMANDYKQIKESA